MSRKIVKSSLSPLTVDTLRRCAFRSLGWTESTGTPSEFLPSLRRIPQPPYHAVQKWADLEWHPREAAHCNRVRRRPAPAGLLGCLLPLAKIHRLLIVGQRVAWEILEFHQRRCRRLPPQHLAPLRQLRSHVWTGENQRPQDLRQLSASIQGLPGWRARDPRRREVLRGLLANFEGTETFLSAHEAVFAHMGRALDPGEQETWGHARWHLAEARALVARPRWFLHLGPINRCLAVTGECHALILRRHDRWLSEWEQAGERPVDL